ncbi:MAG: hypothetical protein J0L56_17095 [Chitinophagales bacterium]|nr:hypothetical protein [Chitinophagales bacterium]
MKSSSAGIPVCLLFSVIVSTVSAQTTRTFNQNSSRSGNGLSLSFAPVYSTASNSSSDSLLFRGSGTGFRFGADYFFGKASIGFLSGFGSSSADNATINTFLKTFPFSPDELIINKTKQQNMYLLLGPSLRFGKTVELFAHAKGGLFINNSGLVSLQQKGAQRPLYRNEATSKSIYPGFLTGLGIQYKTRSEAWSFGIGADYLSTKSEVNNYDIRRGAEPLKLSRTISDIVTGITVRYNILSPRDHSSGQASGKRTRDAGSGMASGKRERGSGLATGRRTYQPGQPVYGNITREESNNAGCGPVTQRTINPDGTTEEMTFSCPDDAANYNNRMNINGGMPNRISMNVTVPKQTQGATFGEKVNQGLHAAGGALAKKVTTPKQTQGATFGEKVNQGLHAAGRNIISGKLSWTSPASTGIVTNKTMAGGGGGGAAAASYAATGLAINNNNSGIVTGFYARDHSSGQSSGKRTRDAGSGMASGKRSRETGSGMSTGRRQYEPVFADNEGGTCETCIATAKLSSVQNNPLYEDKGNKGENPLYEPKGKLAINTGCDGVEGITVSLLEPQSGALIAKTKTGSCGDFFFANVPDGDYILAVSGSFLSKKGYDYYAAKSTDLLGQVTVSDASMQLLINSSTEGEPMTTKAGISTSRSNIRRSVTIIEADTDGDGLAESTKVLATMNDGTVKDVTADARISTAGTVKKVTVRGWDPEKKQGMAGAPGLVKEYTISIDADNKTTMTSQYENGTKEETAATTKIIQHAGVKQYDINTGDTDDDGVAALIKTKTKSNQSNDRVAAGDTDEEIWSPRSNISEVRLTPVAVDENGITYMTTAPPVAPTGPVLRPGSPIGGLSIKGGKNPGGNQRTMQTNENGEFEFTDLEPGDYTFTVEQQVVIESRLWVSAGKAQDHNSTRSNKTASAITPDPGNDGGIKAQDHNSSRSNKSSSLAAPGPDAGEERKGITKLTASQNSQSLRSISAEADLDGDGVYETDITNTTKDEIMVNDKAEITTTPQQKTGISTSRSNIRNRNNLQLVGEKIYVGYGTAVIRGKSVPVKLVYKVVEKATSGLKDTLKTQV